MKRTLFALAALAVISLGACKKDEDNFDTVRNNVPDSGTLRFKNLSNDLYDFYLDDVKYGDLYGGDSADFRNITAVGHRVKAIQRSNIVGNPILRQQTVFVKKDTVTVFQFPL